MKIIEGFPILTDTNYVSSVCIRGDSVYVKTDSTLSSICLQSAKIIWLIEYPVIRHSEETRNLPRRIQSFRNNLWVDQTGSVAAEINENDDGTLRMIARNADSGAILWQETVPIPEAADWAESQPAWPGARTEEIDAFLCDDPSSLVLGLARRSRHSALSDPSRGIYVMTFPPYRCQTDFARYEPSTGEIIWKNAYCNVYVAIMERDRFQGVWSHLRRLGNIDLVSGENRILLESPHQLGRPVRDGLLFAVPWHSKREVGIEWRDVLGVKSRSTSWAYSKVKSTMLHSTEAGLALQINDQFLTWLGAGAKPLWNVQAKPYIYKILAYPGTDVFIGTDGRGGRLFGFEPGTGEETFNHKPVMGGKGDVMRIPGQDIILSSEWVSKSYSVPRQLFVFNMRENTFHLEPRASGPVCAWEGGAVCRAGRNSEQLAILDIDEFARTD